MSDLEQMQKYQEDTEMSENMSENMNAEMSEERLRECKKWFNQLGLRYVIGTFLFMAAQIASMFISPLFVSEEIVQKYNLSFIMLPAYLIAVPLFLWIVSKMNGMSPEKNKMGFGQILGFLCACIALMLIGNLIGSVINAAIASVVGGSGKVVINTLVMNSQILQSIIVFVIGAPIIEELLFRKFLMDRTLRYGEGLAIIVSALAFGLYHGNIVQFVYATLIGMVLAYVYAKTGKVVYTVIMHMLINFWGSIVGPIVVEGINKMDALMSAAAAITVGEGAELNLELLEVISQYGFIITIYAIVEILGVIVGIVVIIKTLKKLKLREAEAGYALPKGKVFSTVFCNPGVILFVIIWIAMAVISVMS